MKEYCKTDVLIVGGGPAGIGAALAAARKGAKTLLIESHGFFGGIGSFSLGMPMNQMCPKGRNRSAVHELVIEKLLAYGDLAVKIGEHQLRCNVEYLKVALLDALDHVGCKYLVHARAVDALLENDRILGLVVATKNGLAIIRARVVVDCTGDADVAHFAGAETMKGRKDDGFLSPMTLCLIVSNVEMERANDAAFKAQIDKVVKQARDKYPLIPQQGWALNRFPSSNCYRINHAGTKDHGVFDGTDLDELTQAECLSRRQAVQMVAAMREFGGDALKNIELVCAGPQIGVRETRRVKGEYILTEEDAKTGRKFDDVIAWRSGFLDIGYVRLEKMKIHDVPYRAILPEQLDGLLAAGRCISATHAAASAGKSMGNCMATGHAAGLAAAISSEKACMPRDLNIKELQGALRADGVDLTRGGEEQ